MMARPHAFRPAPSAIQKVILIGALAAAVAPARSHADQRHALTGEQLKARDGLTTRYAGVFGNAAVRGLAAAGADLTRWQLGRPRRLRFHARLDQRDDFRRKPFDIIWTRSAWRWGGNWMRYHHLNGKTQV